MCQKLVILATLFALACANELAPEPTKLFTIKGVVEVPAPVLRGRGIWQADISLSLNHDEYRGFVQEKGEFVISGLPSGSYLMHVHHPELIFLPVRVDISLKGQFRARKVNYIKPSELEQLPYPLRLRALRRRRFFEVREQWHIIDVLLNPMVLIMVLPLILMLVLPKLINDPETKREIENIQFPGMSHDMPDLSELVTRFMSGLKSPEKEKKALTGKPNKKRKEEKK